MLYLDGEKKESIKMLLHTIAWLFVMFVVFLMGQDLYMQESNYFKIKVTLSKANVDEVRNAFGEAGAEKMGNYDYCSFSYPVEGRFRPQKGLIHWRARNSKRSVC